MLATYPGIIEKRTETDGLDSNWIDLKGELLQLAQYRVDTVQQKWYRDVYIEYMMDIDSFYPTRYSEINRLPQGILAEVFFLNACRQNMFNCVPSYGEEDIMGADFKLTYGDETRFFDVSINTSGRSMKKKVKEGTFPTLFLPWKKDFSDNGDGPITYAERYLKYGRFDGKTFLHSILDSNYIVLDSLKRKVWREEDVQKKIFNNESLDLSESGIQYIRTLEGVLLLMRRYL